MISQPIDELIPDYYDIADLSVYDFSDEYSEVLARHTLKALYDLDDPSERELAREIKYQCESAQEVHDWLTAKNKLIALHGRNFRHSDVEREMERIADERRERTRPTANK